MSLENFQIPSALVPELYNNCLIDLDNEQINSDSLKTTEIPSLGGNRRQILVLVKETGTIHIHDENLAFLLGILKACQLDMQDIVLVNLQDKSGLDHHVLTQHFSPTRIIGFGIEPADLALPMHFPHYQNQAYNNQVYLMAPDLVSLSSNQEEKRSLWNALKKMFSI